MLTKSGVSPRPLLRPNDGLLLAAAFGVPIHEVDADDLDA